MGGRQDWSHARESFQALPQLSQTWERGQQHVYDTSGPLPIPKRACISFRMVYPILLGESEYPASLTQGLKEVIGLTSGSKHRREGEDTLT